MKSIYLTLVMSLTAFFDTKPLNEFEVLGHDFTVTQFASDYYYTLSWANFFDDYCSCSETINITAAKNSFQSGNNWYTIPNVSFPSSYNRNIGPAKSELLYITVYYTGESPGFPFFCATPVSCSTFVDLFGTLTGHTATIFPPENVSASDDEFDTSITISVINSYQKPLQFSSSS